MGPLITPEKGGIHAEAAVGGSNSPTQVLESPGPKGSRGFRVNNPLENF